MKLLRVNNVVYLCWDPEMSHADALVCDGDQQQ